MYLVSRPIRSAIRGIPKKTVSWVPVSSYPLEELEEETVDWRRTLASGSISFTVGLSTITNDVKDTKSNMGIIIMLNIVLTTLKREFGTTESLSNSRL